MTRSVIIVAGGKGLRMNSAMPKQFISVGDWPVLMWTVKRFWEYDQQMKIVVVLPDDQQQVWLSLCKTYSFSVEHELAVGGSTRFHSVLNGLQMVGDSSLIGVHDGVRPFVSVATIDRCFEAADSFGAAVPVLPSVESIRELKDDATSVARNRAAFCMVQTPQVFKADWLFKAYEQPWRASYTDDASVVEAAGYSISLTEGNRENIKITSPFDLLVAEAILNASATQQL
ncbi:2-C-methyl-D-erythritol 4-phosphate cytidylyltransferase [Geofilum sp. OHC36d9]|uniref:2-C-methyl-D-erythritol 4-phosphate cytidylyltransferase n=1 Tax=Geofilum sp. OHC36d9 TaxID=3458413 RepID=UPI004034C853